MPITRQGHIHNMDTKEPLIMLPPNKRFTRAQAHRLLKMNNIKHDHSATMEHLLYLIQMSNISPRMTEPGKIENDEKEEKVKTPKLALVKKTQLPMDLPNNVPKLRQICKKKKILFKLTDDKMTLVNRIVKASRETA